MASSYAQRKALGDFGESVAASYLEAAGMVVLERNYRCAFGEIDLVVRDRSTLVICEVKTRSSTAYGSPIEAVTSRKAHRLRRLAAHWLAEHEMNPSGVRIDVVSVLIPGKGAPLVERVEGVA